MTDFKYTQISIDDDYNIKIDWKIIDLYSGGEQDLANLCLRLALWQNIGSGRNEPPLRAVPANSRKKRCRP
jgi:hypothetical protein